MTLLWAGARRRGGLYPLPATNTVVTIPTYEGSGATVHPSVVDMVALTGQRWHGYRWWMANTPYPGNNDDFENPSIWATNDRAVWEVPPGVVNPVVPPPLNLSTWHADTELVWDPDNGQMVMFWITNATEWGGGLHAHVSTDGATWEYSGAPQVTSSPISSPMIYRAADGSWMMLTYGLNGYHDLYRRTAPTLLGPWTDEGAVTLNNQPANWHPRHGDMILYNDVWLGIWSTTASSSPGNATRVMVSTDNCLTWTVGSANVLPQQSCYRPTIIPSTEPGYLDVWASTPSSTVRYNRIHESAWLDLLP